ncbi:MAG: twin-arginine translocase subunit TatC [Alistipes sp.]|nr:twin-arginine translocase subunit TatC [Candidatus Alistipes equi]
MEKDANNMTFFEHLDAMRPGLKHIAVVFFLVFITSFCLKDYIMAIILGPMSDWFPSNRFMAYMADITGKDILRINHDGFTLINTAIAGQFNMHIMLALYSALILSIPYTLFEIWLFIKPALTQNEIRGGKLFFFLSTLCMLIGLMFGYFVLSPIAVDFLSGYTLSASITNFIDISSYIGCVLNLCLTTSIVFLLPIFVYFLARMRILSGAFMKKYRKHALVILAILSAIITPPDIMSMFLVVIPLYGLYELSICIAAKTYKAKEVTTQEA